MVFLRGVDIVRVQLSLTAALNSCWNRNNGKLLVKIDDFLTGLFHVQLM